ncbi:MAG: iron chelate uptake ABC transporter family permease subunit [Acidobacteriota bacterium]|nr:iron chelate uptake ABC transporter family permease subunit [Acidobacteriota bacterium]
MNLFAELKNKFTIRRKLIVLASLVVILIFIMLVSADKGSVEITQSQIFAILLKKIGFAFSSDFTIQQEATLFDIRLPRIVLGALVGAALGISGAAMQGIFRNPLADPSLIGISSGAALAATAVVVIGDAVAFSLPPILQLFAFPAAAFAGALVTTLAIYRLATIGGRTVAATLLLAGIALNALAQSIAGFLTFYATDTQIRSLTFWKLGSLGNGSWSAVLTALPFILIPILLFSRLARPLNALLLGESEAGHLGFDIEKIKRQAVILAALSVGASVAFTGLITFVGLIVPHLLRLLIGPDHRYLFPASALLGAILLLSADLIARTLVAPAEMPIGILTAIIGAPFFLWLLIRSGQRSLAS